MSLEERVEKLEALVGALGGSQRDFKTFEQLCKANDTTVRQMQSPCRKAEYVANRRIIARQLRSIHWSLPRIARQLKRTHQAVMHLIKLDKNNENT